ncbi:MAG: DUF2254 domain-containing protein [Vallitaleaceae bacterium]|jgi:uncharacterized membrane protein|nr:DUF2254 domain-containing protein [Vallitaleaceae bacterium]
MIRKLMIWVKGKLYIIPFLFGLSFAIFSVFLLYFDTIAYDRFSGIIPSWLFNTSAKSITLVTLVISSLVTMVTITFSIMMVVLTIYGSQLSSRSLKDFLNKKITLKILGYYIGALIFSLIQLNFGVNENNAMGIGATICIFLLIIGVIVLIYFIHFIAKSIQINLYIDDVTRETMTLLEVSKKHVYSSIYIEGGNIEDYTKELQGEQWEVLSAKSGYIQYYDRKKLLEITKEFNIQVLCDILIGEYILPNEVLIKVYNREAALDETALTEKLLEAVFIGDEPDLFKDISTGSKRIIDVALKALSPGINDPSTAITCIQKIGYLLLEIAKGLEANVYLDEEERVRVIIRSISFHRLLYNHFYQIKHYGGKDMFILEAILTALTKVANESNFDIKKQVWEFAKYLMVDIDLKSYHEMEQKMLSERFYQLSRAVNVEYEFDGWKSWLI